MLNADTGLEVRGFGPQGCEAAARPLGKRIAWRIERAGASAPFRPGGARCSLDKIEKTEWFLRPKNRERSMAPARNVWADHSIRQKIIGHRMAVCGRLGGGCVHGVLRFRGKNGALALLDQPTGNHSVGVFVEPLVQKGRDLFAEIGSVAKPREFIALERVARSGEKELPGWLGAVRGHGILRGREVITNLLKHITNTLTINSSVVVPALWISVEGVEKPDRACSGCAGDYEDPDRTAWEACPDEEPDFQEEEGDEPGPEE